LPYIIFIYTVLFLRYSETLVKDCLFYLPPPVWGFGASTGLSPKSWHQNTRVLGIMVSSIILTQYQCLME